MYNLFFIPFIIIGLYQYRKKKAKLLLIIGIGIFFSFVVYLTAVQRSTLKELSNIDAKVKNDIEMYKKEIESVKQGMAKEEQMKFISEFSRLIASKKYIIYGTKTDYFDKEGNAIKYQPSKEEIILWNKRNKIQKEGYYIIINPIVAFIISVIIGMIIPTRRIHKGNNI